MRADNALRVARYHFVATIRRRLSSYLSLVLVIGVVGGVAMASIANARRTQSSYPTFLASTNPSTLTISIYGAANGGNAGPSIKAKVEKLPGVTRVTTFDTPPLVPISPNGAAEVNTLGFIVVLGSTDGSLLSQDRLAITSGRAANPHRANQIVMTASAARIDKLHLGETFPLGLYGPAQQNNPAIGTPRVKPALRIRATLVGIGVLNTQVVQDDVDSVYGFVFVTPALIREAEPYVPGLGAIGYGIQLAPGAQLPKIESELLRLVPRGDTQSFHVTSQVESQVELAIKPESVALGAFGLIAALACLVLALQSISRLLHAGDEDRGVMRSLGASPATTVIDGMFGVMGALTLGALLALGVAVALSPLGPVGPVRAVYPHPGVSFDGTVMGLGAVILVVGLGVASVALAWRNVPERVSQRTRREIHRSSVLRGAQASGLSVTGVVGTHFALESGQGRTAVPVRSLLVGTVLAVALVVSTLTFSSGLSTLISHPALYGWNWNYALNPTNTVPPGALSLLNRDPDVAAWTGYDYFDAELDKQGVPFLMSTINPKVAPPIISGHGLKKGNQIVLGAATMALLHKKIGDTVVFSVGNPRDGATYIAPTTLTIVGTATLPAVGYSSFVSQHTSMGTGAMVANAVEPARFLKATTSVDPNLRGPDEVFVRLKARVGAAQGRANLRHIDSVANHIFSRDKKAVGNGVSLLGVVRPVQIVDYRSVGVTPELLAGGLALGAIVALGLTLTASVRRRRRDLALLKTFGFTQRQLVATIAWQATVDAVVGIVFGIPLGIVVGRELWTLFAQNINAVSDPTIPVLGVVTVGVGALVFTNLVAVWPGRSAARTPTALVLRAE